MDHGRVTHDLRGGIFPSISSNGSATTKAIDTSVVRPAAHARHIFLWNVGTAVAQESGRWSRDTFVRPFPSLSFSAATRKRDRETERGGRVNERLPDLRD